MLLNFGFSIKIDFNELLFIKTAQCVFQNVITVSFKSFEFYLTVQPDYSDAVIFQPRNVRIFPSHFLSHILFMHTFMVSALNSP